NWTKVQYLHRVRPSKLGARYGPSYSAPRRTTMDQSKRPPTFKERWAASRPTKTVVFWSWLGIGILTMIVGFTWGGWVTGSTARAMAEARGEDAVAKRLAPMCALRFENAADKGQKLQELKDAGAWD